MSARLPIEPLMREAGAPTIGVLADTIGRSRRTVCRWNKHGVQRCAADAAAISIGSHPAYIWTHEWTNRP